MIFIAHGEPQIYEDLLRDQKIDFQRTALEIGDMVVVGELSVCIEIKRDSDFPASIKDGRWGRQLFEMSRHYPLSFAILEGNPWTLLEGNSRSVLMGAKVSASMKVAEDGLGGQVKILECLTPWDTALALSGIHSRVGNVEKLYRKPYVKRRRMTGEDVLVGMFMSIPSIGEKSARALVQEFGSFEKVLVATPEEIAKRVAGFGYNARKGTGRAMDVWRVLHRDMRGRIEGWQDEEKEDK